MDARCKSKLRCKKFRKVAGGGSVGHIALVFWRAIGHQKIAKLSPTYTLSRSAFFSLESSIPYFRADASDHTYLHLHAKYSA
eukprot:scaffold3408_cov154-Skeletonema_menzelii.AAC.4